MLTTRNLALIVVAAVVFVVQAARADDVKSMSVTVECPDGWTPSESTSSCIKFSDGSKTWSDARWDCTQQGGDLVKIPNQEMNDLVASLGNGQFFIGLFDRITFKKWVWAVDFTEPDEYTNWDTDRPLNKWPYRVTMMDSKSGKWFDMSGYRGSRYVCEIFP